MSQCVLCANYDIKFLYEISQNTLPEQKPFDIFNNKLTNGRIDNNGNANFYACNEHNSKLNNLTANSSLPIFFAIKNL